MFCLPVPGSLERERERETNRQTNRQASRQAGRQTDTPTDKQANTDRGPVAHSPGDMIVQDKSDPDFFDLNI